MKARVNCVGVGVIDLIYRVDTLPTGDGKMFADDLREVGGGMAANAAVAVARLGGASQWFGRLGQDEMGERILAGIAAEGVGTASARRVAGLTSSHSIVLVDKRGHRSILIYRPHDLPADPGWIDPARLGTCDAIMADIRWPEGAAFAMRTAREHGLPGVLDADVAEPACYEQPVALASHAIFSQPGLQRAAGCDDVAEALRRMKARTTGFIAVTLGEHGVAWLDGGVVRHMDALKIAAVDTLGAGDAFHGAFALALAERRSLETALAFANTAAGLKCGRPGGRDGVPSRAEVERAMGMTN